MLNSPDGGVDRAGGKCEKQHDVGIYYIRHSEQRGRVRARVHKTRIALEYSETRTYVYYSEENLH